MLRNLLDVSTDNGQEVLATKRIYGHDFDLDFIEVRQVSSSLKEKSTPLFFDFRELTLENGRILNGSLIHSGNDAKGAFWYGPYITLPPGTYTVTFWLKSSATVSLDQLLTLDATTDLGTRVLASMNVTKGDFIYNGQWQPFPLTFQLDQETPGIEFRGIVLWSESEIFLSNIELNKV